MTERVGADFLTRWLVEFAHAVKAHKEQLTLLDAAIGDADHGINMERGITAVLAAQQATPPDGPAALLKQAGLTLVSSVGGASGPLYGTFFLRMAGAAGPPQSGFAGVSVGRQTGRPTDAGFAGEDMDGPAFARAVRAGVDGVVQRGKAEPGDKTMYDALAPAAQALADAVAEGAPLAEALRRAAKAAEHGRDGTTEMRARKGRASYLGERSVGHPDPGATSAALLIGAAAAASTELVD